MKRLYKRKSNITNDLKVLDRNIRSLDSRENFVK